MKIKRILCAALMAAAAQVGFAQMCEESFEGWDGSQGWLPQGWTVEHTDEVIPTLAGGAFTWHVIDPTSEKSMPNPQDGKYYCAIGFAQDADKQDLYQDEWLISPAYQLSEYGGTVNVDLYYAPLFLFDCSPENLGGDPMDFIERRPSANLTIFARPMLENGEWDEDWTEFGNLFGMWRTQTFNTLLSVFSSIDYHIHDTIFLTSDEFKGKVVQIAFRYEGKKGNNMAVDRLRVNYATPYEDATGVGTISTKTMTQTNTCFDLQGRAYVRQPNAHGIVINGGKKVIH